MRKVIIIFIIIIIIGGLIIGAKKVIKKQFNRDNTVEVIEVASTTPSEQSSCDIGEIKSDIDVSYGPSKLDIYYPANKDCKNLPVMMYVHGGGWQNGDKSHQVADKIPYFLSQGFIFISVNYRLAPEFKYPIFNEDVASAVAWVSKNITPYGGNPNRISLMGHSAGGTIVASVGVDASYLSKVNIPRTDLRCVIALDSAQYDLSEAAINKSERTLVTLFSGDVYKDAFGTNPETLKEASPINNIVSGSYIPPFFIVTRGKSDRVDLVKEFSDKLTQAGAYSELIQTQNLSHNEVNDAIGLQNDTLITPYLTKFLTKCR